MANKQPKDRYKGSHFTVIHCKGAMDSYLEAISRVEARKRETFTRALSQQIERLADGHRMSRENFPQEGELPGHLGQQSKKKFNALKRKPLRGYCWLSDIHKNTYFISHYVYKNYDKLDARDTKKVGDNWMRIEEQGHEC